MGLQAVLKGLEKNVKVVQPSYEASQSNDTKAVDQSSAQLEMSGQSSTTETATGLFLESTFPKLNDFTNQTGKDL